MKKLSLLLVFAAIFALALGIPALKAEGGPTLTAEIEVCTDVQDRVPVGTADMFGSDVGELCLWSKITGAEEDTIIRHVWTYNGEELASIELPVRSSSWRTWSRKTVLPEWTGDWEAKVVDGAGNVLATAGFKTAKAIDSPVTDEGGGE